MPPKRKAGKKLSGKSTKPGKKGKLSRRPSSSSSKKKRIPIRSGTRKPAATRMLLGHIHPGAVKAFQRKVRRETGKRLSVRNVLRHEDFKAAYRRYKSVTGGATPRRGTKRYRTLYRALVDLGIKKPGYPLGETPK